MKILTLAFLLLTSVSFAKEKGKGKKHGCWKKVIEVCGKGKEKKGKEARMAWKECRDKAIPSLDKECQEKIQSKMAKKKGKRKERMQKRLEKMKSKLEGASPEKKARIEKRIKKITEKMSEV